MTSACDSLFFIGAGNMAEALIKGVLNAKAATPRDLVAADINTERLAWLHAEYGIRTSNDVNADAPAADAVILAVKPQVLADVLEAHAAHLRPGQTIISIAAGIPCRRIEAHFPRGAALIRAMPNTPALVQRGVTALARGAKARDEDMYLARRLFHSVGTVLEVEEPLIDVITAVSGSGPAYVFYLMEAMIAAGIENGLPPDDALMIVADTVRGAGELVVRTHAKPNELRCRVTSKGGTTAAAVNVLDEHDVMATMHAAVNAAVARSRELAH